MPKCPITSICENKYPDKIPPAKLIIPYINFLESWSALDPNIGLNRNWHLIKIYNRLLIAAKAQIASLERNELTSIISHPQP